MAYIPVKLDLSMEGNQILGMVLERLTGDPVDYVTRGRVWYDLDLDRIRYDKLGDTGSVASEEYADRHYALYADGSVSGTVAIDCEVGGVYDWVLTGPVVLGFSNAEGMDNMVIPVYMTGDYAIDIDPAWTVRAGGDTYDGTGGNKLVFHIIDGGNKAVYMNIENL
jgi:hypothetical protein